MMMDLVQANPIMHEAVIGEDDVRAGPAFFGKTTISLRDKEQQVVIIRAVAQRHLVAFNLDIEYRLVLQPDFVAFK